MIIDSHVHMSEPPYKRSSWPVRQADGTDFYLGLGEGADLSANQLLHDMDECHVEKVFAVAFPGFLSNKFLSEVILL